MFHTKKQLDEIRNCHIGAGILIYRNSDKEIIEEKIIIINRRMLNSGTGKQVEFNIIEDQSEISSTF